MEITDTSRPSSLIAPPPTETQNGAAGLSSDFETFLSMLTAQIENQDPLNPVDSTDFATQLATFSSVEQQVLTNDLLTSLGGQMSALGVSQLSGWVGMNARAIMPVNYQGEAVGIVTETSQIADAGQLVVRNEQGTEVARYDIAPGRQTTAWAGLDNTGTPLPYGTYKLSVESLLAGDVVGTSSALIEGRIVEARNDNGVPILVMAGGQEVPSADIVSLLEPVVPANSPDI
ncbi:MAG: flagellar hook capping FlgD N-terminal domain-containing protein [Pseudomonadota bacterium]